ncbi:IST1-like protein, partial [Cucurbita argyrosperma subsp. sororia]
MFRMFFKPKFYTKCKSCVKMTKTRLDTIRKKKKVVLKFLKNDIVELLKSRLDYNAYNRAEGFLVEQNVLRCYDLIDEFCGTIFKHISVLNKESECPDECKEAVASLIYAAARFSDLPELRVLRSLFTGRYGTSFGSFTNKELVEKLRAVAQTKETKLQLLQEIAQESAIDWNSKALEQQLYVPPQNELDRERSTSTNRNKSKIVSVPVYGRTTNSPRKKENSDDDSIFDSRSEGNTTETSMGDSSTDQDVHKGVVSEDEVEDQKPFYLRFITPPYLKTKPTKKEENVEEPQNVTEENRNDPKTAIEEKPKPRSVRRRHAKPQPARSINIDDAGGSAADGAGKISSGRNKGKEAMTGEEKGVEDDEERMLDGLLKLYSKKKTRQEDKDNAEPQRPKNTRTEDAYVPTKSLSLPPPRTEPIEPVKKHARANSYVHPKLPDYDQLAARFAALKEK